MASISPSTTASVLYTLNASKAVVADLRLVVVTGGSLNFRLYFPLPDPAGLVVELFQVGVAAGIPIYPAAASSAFPGYTINANVQDDAFGVNGRVLTCTITNGTGLDLTNDWQVRARATGVVATWNFAQDQNTTPGSETVRRLMVDPTSAQLAPAPAAAIDGDLVTLSRNPAVDPLAGTVVKVAAAANPAIDYSWTYPEDVAIPGLANTPGTAAFDVPTVYAPLTLHLTMVTRFSDALGAVLSGDSPSVTLDLSPAARHLILVLDRSGSMFGALGGGGQKWAAAVAAAHAWADLALAFRSGVAGVAEKFGVMIFEAGSCSWTPAAATPIDLVVPPGGALGAVGTLNLTSAQFNTALGGPGSCTPIGDALIQAMDRFQADVAPGPASRDRFAILLATDGYENSGAVGVGEPSAASQVFSVARADAVRAEVNSRLSIYTLGIGATVQEDVLDDLTASGPGQHYLLLTSTADMLAYFQALLGSWIGAEEVAHAASPLTGAAEPNIRYFPTDAKEQRLALTLLWGADTDDLLLSHRPQAGGAWTAPAPANVTVRKRSTHGGVVVDLNAEFPAGVPAREWRVEYRTAAGGAVAQPFAATSLLVMVDLYVQAEFSFDRSGYLTGDPMTIRCRLVAGPTPIRGATLRARVDKPGMGLGTFLGSFGAGYQPGAPAAPDPAHPKLQMQQDLLRQEEMSGLPREAPPSIFIDGSDLLRETPAGDYVNTFAGTDKEGTYTWRFLVEGATADGGRFARSFSVSKWVGVNVDPVTSPVVVQAVPPSNNPPPATTPPASTPPSSTAPPLQSSASAPLDPRLVPLPAPKGMVAALVVVRPQDRRGQLLGPFRQGLIQCGTTAGVFPGKTLSLADGRYARTLHYPQGSFPLVTVRIQGKDFAPIAAAPGCLGLLINAARKLLLWLIRLGRKAS